MIEITDYPINFNTVFDRLKKGNSGSIVIHYAVVRSTESGKKTNSIRFVLEGDAEGEMRELERSLRVKWPVEDVLLIRRIGKLTIGEVIAVVAASAEHRESAFELCQEAVNRFKKMKTFTKKEIFEKEEK
jgi:molybdopterin synthase catalytic subunit